jgi:ketosteroid isomerase-like protein
MSQENVEIVRRGMEAFNQNDFEGWFAIASTEIKLYPRPEEPGVLTVYEGWDGVMEYLVNWYSQWEDYEGEPVEFLDAGDQVLVVMRERGRLERDRLEVEQEFSHSFKLREGSVVEWRMYDSHEQALEAVGLSE